MGGFNMYEEIGKMIAGTYLFYEDKSVQDNVKLDLVKKSFQYHYNNNDYFFNLCKASGVIEDNIQTIQDLNKIPLIPIRTFKQPEDETKYLLSVPLDKIENEMRSSGTSGTSSVARRDFDTYTVQQLAAIMTYREFIFKDKGIEKKRGGVFLVPSPADVLDMGMIKGFTLVGFALCKQEFCVENMELNCKKVIDHLKEWEGKLERLILGPPFMLNTFLDYLKEKNIRINLDENSKIITVGGWKHHTGEQISRDELYTKCKEYLGVDRCDIRDFYGLAECNPLIFECEENVKHIPPTFHLTIRDINDPLKEVEDGKEGVVAILDPAAYAYPGFILTEDLGIIRKNIKCSCGRVSDTLQILGRTPKSDLKNCALTLEKYMDEKDKRMNLYSNEVK
jgi:long-chain-fatty-acid---luciferin-component ligase